MMGLARCLELQCAYFCLSNSLAYQSSGNRLGSYRGLERTKPGSTPEQKKKGRGGGESIQMVSGKKGEYNL